jgi:hypothetical protein
MNRFTQQALALMLSGCFTGVSLAQRTLNDAAPIVVGYPIQGAVLGQAYDFVSGQWLPTRCVDGISVPLGASELRAKYTDLQDREQIFDSLKLSAEASVNTIALSSAKINVDFAKSVDINRERRNILAVLDAMRGGTQLTPAIGQYAIRLSPEAKVLAANDVKAGTTKFRAMCGDGYVATVRAGAKIRLVFSTAIDKSDIEQSLKIAAEGRYGTIQGKASMERIQKDKNSKENTSVAFYQEGGRRKEIPVDAPTALEVMKSAGDFDDSLAAPMELVVMPYGALPDLPPEYRKLKLPDIGVRSLAAHYWRLVELSALYAGAANSPINYYHPYIEPKKLGSKSYSLKTAALCVSEMLETCSSSTTSSCTLDVVWKIASEAGSCKLIKTGISLTNEAASQSEALEAAQLISGGDISIMRGQPFKQGTQIGLYEESRGPGTRPYDYYLKFLVRAPMKRVRASDGKSSPGDEFDNVLMFCSLQSLNCKDKTFDSTIDQTNGRNPALSEGLALFNVRFKLAQLSASACGLSIEHPLCISPDALPWYMYATEDGSSFEEAVFTAERGFFKESTPVVVPPPPKPRPPPRPCDSFLKPTNPCH